MRNRIDKHTKERNKVYGNRLKNSIEIEMFVLRETLKNKEGRNRKKKTILID